MTKDEFRIKVKYKTLGTLFVVAVLLWGGYWLSVYKGFDDWAERGQFGDLFGGFNALFSGLALAVLVYTIYLQHEELRLQRLELEQTRKELKGQKEQLKMQNETMQKQNQTMQKQSFESSFFQLLGFHNDIINSITSMEDRIKTGGTGKRMFTSETCELKGRECFGVFYRFLKDEYSQEKDDISRANKVFFKYHHSKVGHYFRNLYNIIKFIDNSPIEDKQMYANLVRAQLSSHEHVLLFYNCLGEYGREKFKPFIEKYALLKNMPKGLLFSSKHEHLYKPQAFGSI